MIRFTMTIPLNPITKKNSMRIIRTGEYSKLLPSKQFLTYQEAAGWYLNHKGELLDIPLQITEKFYMGTKRNVDLTNLEEAIDDILVHYGVIKDDNCSIIVSHDGSRVYYDKENPRTEIIIEKYVEGEGSPC